MNISGARNIETEMMSVVRVSSMNKEHGFFLDGY